LVAQFHTAIQTEKQFKEKIDQVESDLTQAQVERDKLLEVRLIASIDAVRFKQHFFPDLEGQEVRQ
jgi:hypothetical protein